MIKKIICTTIAVAFMFVALSNSSIVASDFDGDICTNPWADEFFTTPSDLEIDETTGSKEEITTNNKETTSNIEKSSIGKTKVKKATKAKKSNKLKLSLKKVKGVKKYFVQVSKGKKFTKKNILVKKTVKKVTITIKSNKFKNKKKLWVRARATKALKGKQYFGKWSPKKQVLIKK